MFWDTWFGTVKEKRTQLYFPDYGGFQFRKLALEDSCLVEKNGKKEIVKAWKHFYCAQIPFSGFKKIHADMVTLGFDRDFILDLFNKVPVQTNSSGKPDKSEESIKKWTAQVAESQRYKVMTHPGGMLPMDKIIAWLGVALVIMAISLGISKAWG